MACIHKFYDDLFLDRIDFEPSTLIVGTFNPAWPEDNKADWFYGRTHDETGKQNNNFWDILPKIYGEKSLINANKKMWTEFCSDKKIAITDLISAIDDAFPDNNQHIKWLKSYSDKDIATKFKQHKVVDIVKLLEKKPTIKNVYLTRGSGETFWRRLWKPISEYASNKRITNKTLLTPSGYAFYQHGKWNNENPNNKIEQLSDFILFKWRQKWHTL